MSRRASATPLASDELVVNVAGLLAEPPGSSRELRLAGVVIALGEDLSLSRPIAGDVRIARTNRGVLVKADLGLALDESCARCLQAFELPLEVAFEDEVLPSIDLTSGLPLDIEEEPEAARLTDHHELDLEPLVREAILLAEPIAPVCRADCPGLCVECGLELATGPHDHPDADVDPRLAALQAFLVDGEEQKH